MKILVVDDEQLFSKAFIRLLETFVDFNVHRNLLFKLKKNKFSLWPK